MSEMAACEGQRENEENAKNTHHIYVNMEFVCETEYLENTFTSRFFIIVAIIVCYMCGILTGITHIVRAALSLVRFFFIFALHWRKYSERKLKCRNYNYSSNWKGKKTNRKRKIMAIFEYTHTYSKRSMSTGKESSLYKWYEQLTASKNIIFRKIALAKKRREKKREPHERDFFTVFNSMSFILVWKLNFNKAISVAHSSFHSVGSWNQRAQRTHTTNILCKMYWNLLCC